MIQAENSNLNFTDDDIMMSFDRVFKHYLIIDNIKFEKIRCELSKLLC